METLDLLKKCVEFAKEKKAFEIISLSMKDLTTIADYFLILSAANIRQGKAVADYVEEKCKDLGHQALRIEGYKDGRWILMDYGSLIIHIFQEDERAYYNLERLWGDAPKESYES